MSDFVTVGQGGEVGEGEVGAYMVGDRTVAVANVGGTLYAFDDVCTHRGCSLAEGELDGSLIECPCHGSQFDVTTGEAVTGPATEPVDAFEVRVDGDDLQISLG